MPPTYFRYLLPHNPTVDRELIYFPFWRFKGILYSCVNAGVVSRFVDSSQQAIKSTHFPFSAGIRPQVGKLTFATEKSKGRFLRPDIPYADAINLFKTSLARFVPKPIYHQSYIGEIVSLLYAPFYLSGRLFDAMQNKPVTSRIPDNLEDTLSRTEKVENRTRLFATICPACGWDLDGEKDAALLICKNCQTAWQPTKKGFKKLPLICLTEMGRFKTSFPFWRIAADVDGVSMGSVADFRRLANISQPAEEKDTEARFHFWVPAFKVRPKMLLTLSRRLTVAQIPVNGDKKLPEGAMIPANLPVTEAAQTLKIVFAELVRPSRIYFPRLSQIQIVARQALLVYIPFNEDHHDYIQPKLNIGIGKKLLKLAENM